MRFQRVFCGRFLLTGSGCDEVVSWSQDQDVSFQLVYCGSSGYAVVVSCSQDQDVRLQKVCCGRYVHKNKI